MEENVEDLIFFFKEAIKSFVSKNKRLFEIQVSERTLCGALMIELYEKLKETDYSKYYVDVEYNRNVHSKIKSIKQIQGDNGEGATINCDLIVHRRGERNQKDNLIALEMKKSKAKKANKDSDRKRIRLLTMKPSYIESEEKEIHKYVCGYKLGIYCEINFQKRTILIEYYKDGKQYTEEKQNKIDLYDYENEVWIERLNGYNGIMGYRNSKDN